VPALSLAAGAKNKAKKTRRGAMKKNKGGKEWFGEKEASTSTRPYRLTFWCLKHLPRWLVNFITYCAALYFFIFDKRCRRESLRYQRVLRA
jgi:hypothetical protein